MDKIWIGATVKPIDENKLVIILKDGRVIEVQIAFAEQEGKSVRINPRGIEDLGDSIGLDG